VEALYVFVEGPDDKRLLEIILRNLSLDVTKSTLIYEYANKPKHRVIGFLRTIRRMGAHYYFLLDKDAWPCITGRKGDLCVTYPDLEQDRIVVVSDEIEAWYWSGLGRSGCEDLGIEYLTSTETVTKEALYSAIPARFGSRLDFLLEAARRFSLQEAEETNSSLRYLIRRLTE
jgi:hypothetical protein